MPSPGFTLMSSLKSLSGLPWSDVGESGKVSNINPLNGKRFHLYVTPAALMIIFLRRSPQGPWVLALRHRSAYCRLIPFSRHHAAREVP